MAVQKQKGFQKGIGIFWNVYEIISEIQHGFVKKKRSTTTATFNFVSNVIII